MPDQETWLLFGDKNIVKHEKEKKGALALIRAIKTLISYNCRDRLDIFYLPYKGCFYTWNKHENGLIFFKLDRGRMGLDFIPFLNLKQLPSLLESLSTLCGLVLVKVKAVGDHKPFKIFNFWVRHP